jgi:peptidyl-prolyl cis-trans isomerase SurA
MAFRILFKVALALVSACALAQPKAVPQDKVVSVDRVIAVINDEAITQHDLDDSKRIVLQQLKQQKVDPPARDVLDKQVLERMLTEKSLLQFAKENGVKVDDTQIERAILRIAQENKLSAEDFRKALQKENIPYPKYREDIRNELTVQRIREREVDSKITVSDAEVDQYLASIKSQAGGDSEYNLAHILVIVPEQASAEQIDVKKRRADDALRALRGGADFAQVAAAFSEASDALKGGNLGWRSGARLPTVFADQVRKMRVGEISSITRSSAGFHIVKLLDKRTHNDSTVVDQIHARHILIRVNEVVSESDAKAKIDRLKQRLDSGAKFEEIAKLNSEDSTSSKGGDLGWLNPGDTVVEFDEAMRKLEPGHVSDPVRTTFGWHLIEVIERRRQDITADRERSEALVAIRQRKSDEAFQDWVRQIRDQAYVEIRLDDK